jgi:hypothetical protein
MLLMGHDTLPVPSGDFSRRLVDRGRSGVNQAHATTCFEILFKEHDKVFEVLNTLLELVVDDTEQLDHREIEL